MDESRKPDPSAPAPIPGTGDKAWYRRLERTLGAIERSEGVSQMLSEALGSIVRDLQADLGVVGGRLYQRKGSRYVLTHQTGRSSAPLGYKIPIHYAPIKELLKSGYLLMGESDPGFDPRIEEVVGVKLFAAIIVGEKDEYAISFTLRGKIHRGRTAHALNTIRHVINLKLREQALFNLLLEAREIQVSLLPKTSPRFGPFDIHGRSVPAEVVGGDLYDFLPVSEETLGLAIADASGHGLPAALQARDVIIGLRMGMAEDLKIVKTLERLNRVIHRSALSSKFVSLFYGELDALGNFIYSNCGHPAPLLLHRDRFRELSEGGPVLGPRLGVRYMRGYVSLRPGDVLVLYTDGVSEAADAGDAEFGVDRIRSLVAENAGRPAAEIVERLFGAVQEHSGLTTPRDDQTVVAVRAR